jgi:hypothetical protein
VDTMLVEVVWQARHRGEVGARWRMRSRQRVMEEEGQRRRLKSMVAVAETSLYIGAAVTTWQTAQRRHGPDGGGCSRGGAGVDPVAVWTQRRRGACGKI